MSFVDLMRNLFELSVEISSKQNCKVHVIVWAAFFLDQWPQAVSNMWTSEERIRLIHS